MAEEAEALDPDDGVDPDDPADPLDPPLDPADVATGAGGAIRTGFSGFVVTGFETVRAADVMEILTALGWMPNFSSVDDTASDNAP